MATIGATLQIYDRFTGPLKDYANGIKTAAQAGSTLKNSMANSANGVNFDRPTRELSNLATQAEKTDGIFKKMLGANIIGAGIVKGIGAISSGITGLMGDLSASSATWQTFQGNMEQLGASKTDIASAKKAMQDYATQTIYSASDMASTYSQLAAVGTKNTGELVKGFGGLAAASEDPAQAMKTLSQQATQMAAKPKVAWEDFKLMLEQSPAGMAAVAKTMGISTGDLIKKIQAGTVKTQDFFDAIQKTGTNANFTKMATQFKTVGQAVDGLKETLTNALQPAFDKVSKIGIAAVSGISDMIGSVDFSSIADKIISFFSNVGKKAGEFWNTFKSTGAVIAVVDAFFAIKGAIDTVMATLKNTDGKSLFTLKDAATVLGNAVVWAANQIENLATFIQRLDPNIIKAIATAAGIALTAFLGWKGITGVIGGVSGAIKGLSGAFTGVGSAMGFMAKHPILSAVIALAAAFAYAYMTSEKFRNGVNTVASAIGKAVSAVADFIVKNKELVGTLSVPAIAGFGLLIAGLSGKFGKLAGPLSKISGLFKGLGKAKASGAGKVAEDITKVTDAGSSFKSVIGKGLSFTLKAVGVAAVIGSLALLAKSLEGIANAGAQAPANLAAFGAVVAGLAGTFALFGSKLQSSMVGIAVFAASMSVLALAMAPIANAGQNAATNLAAFGLVVAGLAVVFAVFGSALTASMLGIGVFALSMSMIALAMAPIANAGANAATNMATFGLVVAGLVVVFALFGSALTLAIPAMLAFGATILMIGAGIGMAAPGLAMMPPIIMALGLAFSMAAMAVATAITMIIGAVAGLVTTIAGAIMGIVETVGNTLVNVFQQAGDSISQVVTSIGDSISQVVTAISDGVSQVVTSVGGAVSGVLNSLAKVFDSIGTAALNAGTGFSLLADGISQLVNLSLGDLVGTLTAVSVGLGAIALSGPGLTVAGAGMTILGAGTMLFATAAMAANVSMAPLTAAIQALSTTLPLIGAAATVAGAAMTVFAATVLISLASLIGATAMLTAFMAVMTMTGATMGIVSALAMVASAGFLMFGAAATMASVMVTMLNVSLMMVSMSAMMANMSLTAMVASLSMVGIGLLTITSASLALMATLTMISAATMLVDAALIVLAVSSIAATASMIALGATATIAGAGMVIAGAGAVAAGTGLVVLAAGITAVGASLVVLSAGIMTLYSTIASVFLQIVSAVSSAMSNVVSTVSGGIQSAIGAVQSASGSLVGAGRDFVMGFVNGIKGAIGAAAEAAASMAKSAVDAAKSLLNIHSPSRLMRDQVGKYVALGMAVGIIANTSAVNDASADMATSAVKSAQGYTMPDIAAGQVAGYTLPEAPVLKDVQQNYTVNAAANNRVPQATNQSAVINYANAVPTVPKINNQSATFNYDNVVPASPQIGNQAAVINYSNVVPMTPNITNQSAVIEYKDVVPITPKISDQEANVKYINQFQQLDKLSAQNSTIAYTNNVPIVPQLSDQSAKINYSNVVPMTPTFKDQSANIKYNNENIPAVANQSANINYANVVPMTPVVDNPNAAINYVSSLPQTKDLSQTAMLNEKANYTASFDTGLIKAIATGFDLATQAVLGFISAIGNIGEAPQQKINRDTNAQNVPQLAGKFDGNTASGAMLGNNDDNSTATTSNSNQTNNFNFGNGAIVVQSNGNESGEELLNKIAAAARKYSDKGLAF
ncbi:tape measure protein [Leuconostoc citreum]|uniref:tape measure protein n=1 Tax=Leuconostoc citreum TaxID=33964 RepID=UPI001C1FED51|nr:tape measure protein [Leuconostoc citreum]MBU7450656.1 tape measure protein [Leuconostoc citreum]